MEQNPQTIDQELQPSISPYEQLKKAGAVFLASGAMVLGYTEKTQADSAASPVGQEGNVPTLNAQVGRAGDISEQEYQKDQYCIQQGLYSFNGGLIGYGKPDRKGRFLRVRQHVEADPLPNMCRDRVTREIGVRQIMSGHPNTNYRAISRAPGEIDKTITQRGYRAWKCFKRFRQQVFVTVTTDEGYGQRKVYNGRSSRPNC